MLQIPNIKSRVHKAAAVKMVKPRPSYSSLRFFNVFPLLLLVLPLLLGSTIQAQEQQNEEPQWNATVTIQRKEIVFDLEHAALVRFHDAMSGRGNFWPVDEQDHCEWQGVTCDGTRQFVQEIRLRT